MRLILILTLLYLRRSLLVLLCLLGKEEGSEHYVPFLLCILVGFQPLGVGCGNDIFPELTVQGCQRENKLGLVFDQMDSVGRIVWQHKLIQKHEILIRPLCDC